MLVCHQNPALSVAGSACCLQGGSARNPLQQLACSGFISPLIVPVLRRVVLLEIDGTEAPRRSFEIVGPENS